MRGYPKWIFGEANHKSAIYGILNLLNGKIYIGSAVDYYHRLRTHKSKLKYNVHVNKHLQSAWNEYGQLAFEFIILEYIFNRNDLIDREQFWINLTDCHNPELGYNIRKIAKSNLGLKKKEITLETRLRLSIANKGKKHSDETKAKLSLLSKGRKLTDEHKEKVRITSLGRVASAERKAKIGVANGLPDKWPHPNKSACKCRECKDKRNLAERLRSYNHEGKYSYEI